jgi:hypothetical protein
LAGWKSVHRIVIVVGGQCYLLQVILALCSPGRFAGGLHRGQKQGDEDADDGDDDEELDQGKRATLTVHNGPF